MRLASPLSSSFSSLLSFLISPSPPPPPPPPLPPLPLSSWSLLGATYSSMLHIAGVGLLSCSIKKQSFRLCWFCRRIQLRGHLLMHPSPTTPRLCSTSRSRIVGSSIGLTRRPAKTASHASPSKCTRSYKKTGNTIYSWTGSIGQAKL